MCSRIRKLEGEEGVNAKLTRYTLVVSCCKGAVCLIIQGCNCEIVTVPPIRTGRTSCFQILDNYAASNGIPEEERRNLRTQLEEAFRKDDAETRQP